jgi:type IV secretory pathway TraG/TraD family ATPase VirD4
VANQDLGDVAYIYGKEKKATFYNNFNTNFIFRINDPETSEFLSRAVGEKQVYNQMESTQMGPKNKGANSNLNTQDKQIRVLLPSEFQNLEDLKCIVKIANIGISKFEIPKVFYDSNNDSYIKKRT